MSFIWPREGVSLVLLPASELGDQVFDLALEWTRHRLLTPALYVKLDEQDPGALVGLRQSGPAKLLAHVVGRNGSRQVSLMDELTRNDLDLLRIVACRIVEDSAPYHERQDKFVDRLREQVKLAAPHFEEDAKTRLGTELLLINLIAGPTMRGGGSTKHLLEVEWDANVILSPEDRSTPTGFDSFTQETEQRFAGFLMSNLASTAGLWTGVNKSLLELSDIETSVTFDKVLVQRTFVRVVKTDGVAVKMAASGLRWIEEEGNPANNPTFVVHNKERLREEEFNDAISKVVAETLAADGGALTFNFKSRKNLGDKIKVGFREAFKMFFSFFWGRIKALPRNLWEAFISLVNRKSTEVFFGADGDYEVEVRRGLDRIGLNRKDVDELERIERKKKLVQEQLDEMKLKTAYRSAHPNLWRAQRKIVTDLLDGTYDAVPGKILANPEHLVPKKGEEWEVPSFVLDPDEDPEQVKSTLDWLDADRALKLSDQLGREVAALSKEARELGLEMIAAEKDKDATKALVRQIRGVSERTASRERSLRSIIEGVSDVNV